VFGLTWRDDVFLLDMREGESRIGRCCLEALDAALDEIAS
jgi:hypothetical protein